MPRAPQLKPEATVLSANQIRVDFDELMLHNTALLLVGNYVFSGPTTLAPVLVSAQDVSDETHVTISISGEMKIGDEYTVSVHGMVDANDQLPVNPSFCSAGFEGVGTAPQVDGVPVSSGHTELIIRFSKPVLYATEADNYSIDPALDILSAEQYGDTLTYLLVTDPQLTDQEYDLSLSAAIVDRAGNPIGPDHDTVSFVGKVNDPPVVSLLYPVPGLSGLHPKERIQVNARDPQRGIGIDESSWNVFVTRYLLDGSLEILYPIVGGVLQSNFDGERSGNPDLPEGVTWSFVPKNNWAPTAQYTVTSVVLDKEGASNDNQQVGNFRTGTSVYIEDLGLTLKKDGTPYDVAILTLNTTASLRNSFALKAQLLPRITKNREPIVQARTLLFWAARTEVRSLVLSVADLSLIAGMEFGERAEVIALYEQMVRFVPGAFRAVDELRSLSAEAREFLKKLLRAQSPLHVVSALAAIAVIGSFQS